MNRSVRWLIVIALLVGLAFNGSGKATADVTGDGLDEVGAFAVETTSSDNWLQIWRANGTNQANQKGILAGHSQLQFFTTDANGTAGEEVVIGAVRDSDGFAFLQVRNQNGVVLATQLITGAGFSGHQYFPVQLDGLGGIEIGVGFVRDSDGVAFYRVYRLVSGVLNLVKGEVAISGLFGNHQWSAGDFNADGTDEILLGTNRKSDNAAHFQVFEPQTGTIIGNAFVTGVGFSEHKWLHGDFANLLAGREIVVSFKRDSDSVTFFQTWNRFGGMIAGNFITDSAFGQHTYKVIDGGTFDQLLVGFVRLSDGVPTYRIYSPATGALASGKFVVGVGFTVVDWLAGNFDGNAANGEEVVVGFVRNSDGAIGFQHWNRSGTTQNGGGFLLGGTFVNPEIIALKPVTTARHDLLLGAQNTGGAPIFKLQNVNGFGVASILTKFIFNNNVV